MVYKIQFTDEELEDLVKDKHSCVEIQKGEKHIGIHPFFLNNLSRGINETLSKMISRYDHLLNGIILMYKNPKVLQQNGTISTGTGHIYVDISAEFYIFRPEVNKLCNATVNKTGKDHIGCLVHKTFNVSIPKPASDPNWKGSTVKVGDEILVKITFTDLFYIIPYIRGEIIKVKQVATKENGISDISGEMGDELWTSLKDSRKKKKKKENSKKRDSINGGEEVANKSITESTKKRNKNSSDLVKQIVDKSINESPQKRKKSSSDKKKNKKLNGSTENDLVQQLIKLEEVDLVDESPKKPKRSSSDKKRLSEIESQIVDKSINESPKKRNKSSSDKKRPTEVESVKQIVNKSINESPKNKRSSDKKLNSSTEDNLVQQLINLADKSIHESPVKPEKKRRKSVAANEIPDLRTEDDLIQQIIKLEDKSINESPVKRISDKKRRKSVAANGIPDLRTQDDLIQQIIKLEDKSINESPIKPLSEKKRRKSVVVREIADLPDRSMLDSPGFSSTLKPSGKKRKRQSDISWNGVENE